MVSTSPISRQRACSASPQTLGSRSSPRALALVPLLISGRQQNLDQASQLAAQGVGLCQTQRQWIVESLAENKQGSRQRLGVSRPDFARRLAEFMFGDELCEYGSCISFFSSSW